MARRGCIQCLGFSGTLASIGLRCCCAWGRQSFPPHWEGATSTASHCQYYCSQLVTPCCPSPALPQQSPRKGETLQVCHSPVLGVGPIAHSQPQKQLEIILIYPHSLTLPFVFFHFKMYGRTLVSNLPLPRPASVRPSAPKPSTKVRSFEYLKYPHPSQRLSVNMPHGKASTDAGTLLNIRLRHDFKRQEEGAGHQDTLVHLPSSAATSEADCSPWLHCFGCMCFRKTTISWTPAVATASCSK